MFFLYVLPLAYIKPFDDRVTQILRFQNETNVYDAPTNAVLFYFDTIILPINGGRYDFRNLRDSRDYSRVRYGKTIKRKILKNSTRSCMPLSTKYLKTLKTILVYIYSKFHETYLHAVNFSAFKLHEFGFISIQIRFLVMSPFLFALARGVTVTKVKLHNSRTCACICVCVCAYELKIGFMFLPTAYSDCCVVFSFLAYCEKSKQIKTSRQTALQVV